MSVCPSLCLSVPTSVQCPCLCLSYLALLLFSSFFMAILCLYIVVNMCKILSFFVPMSVCPSLCLSVPISVQLRAYVCYIQSFDFFCEGYLASSYRSKYVQVFVFFRPYVCLSVLMSVRAYICPVSVPMSIIFSSLSFFPFFLGLFSVFIQQ